MACYRLTKPQPLPFIAFPKIQIQTVHMAGYKKNSTCKKREPVSAANICVVLKMRLPRRTGEGRNQERRCFVNKNKIQGQSDRNPFLSKVQAALLFSSYYSKGEQIS